MPLPYSLWRRKLNRIFDEQLRDLVVNRHIFRQANNVWRQHEGGNRGGRLAQWMVQNYLAFATTTIRRLTERPNQHKSQKSLSLVILLADMAAHHKLLSRRWYASMYRRRIIRDWCADDEFSRLCGSTKAPFMPKRRIQADIAAIQRAVRPIKRLVDKVVAHTEQDKRKRGRPKWGQIDEAVDLLVNIYKRYHELLTAAAHDPFEVERFVNVTGDLEKIWPRDKQIATHSTGR